MQPEEKVIHISIDLIVPSKHQPRKVFDESALNELSNSIKEFGILNPILVTKKEDKYEIIAGERRYRAAKMAGLTEVPVIVKTYEEAKMAQIALIENLHREDLNPMEEAKSYQEIMRLSNITQKELGEKLGKSQAAVANKIRLLNLPPKIQDAVSNKKISERHARSLMQVEDEEEQLELLNKVIENRMTVKELDNLINQQTITEKEIQDAINDIMKSLNINVEEEKDKKTEKELNQKEEKESDNMNNGNFFPNFDNTMGNNNNVSLNSMNMQSMGATMMTPTPEQQTIQNPMSQDFMAAPSMQQMDGQTPVMNNNFMQDAPLFDNNLNNQVMPQVDVMSQPQEMVMPNLEQPMMAPVMEQPLQMENQPQVNQFQDAPLFDNNFNNQVMPQSDFQPNIMNQEVAMEVPNMMPEQKNNIYMNGMENNIVEPTSMMNQNPEPIVPTPAIPDFMAAPVVEEQPMMAPVMEQETSVSSFEIPVNAEPVASPVVEMPTESVDKLSELKAYLEQNGINYKQYSNETGNCIIIEM